MAQKRPSRQRIRLDRALVDAKLVPSREKAQALILAGRVRVDGRRCEKAGTPVDASARLEIAPGRRPFASRGGEKLDGVLDPLGLDPRELACLDVGASTGGFTDVLLRRGAARVTAVDVGRGLLDQRLRQDPRVELVEGVNARYIEPEQVRPPYDLATTDLSFISVTLVLPAILPLIAAGGRLLSMVKPQFEVGRAAVGQGGVVRDPRLREEAVSRVAHFLLAQEWGILGFRASPLAGPKGNREVFLLAFRGDGLSEEEWKMQLHEEIGRGAD